MKKIVYALFAIALVVLFALVAPHSGPVFSTAVVGWYSNKPDQDDNGPIVSVKYICEPKQEQVELIRQGQKLVGCDFDVRAVYTYELTQEHAGGWALKSQAAKEKTGRCVDRLTDAIVAECGRDYLRKVKAGIIVEVEGEAAGNEAARDLTERARKRLKEMLTP
jgi:hypothetical protein